MDVRCNLCNYGLTRFGRSGRGVMENSGKLCGHYYQLLELESIRGWFDL
jgi:hypothetical protein